MERCLQTHAQTNTQMHTMHKIYCVYIWINNSVFIHVQKLKREQDKNKSMQAHWSNIDSRLQNSKDKVESNLLSGKGPFGY